MISLIIPLYNKASFVEETINSVINQTIDNWELIVVDDGSTDGSFDLVAKQYSSDSRIKLLERKNFKAKKGASVCRNIGLSLAKGEYIIFLDADDLLVPSCLKVREESAYKFPNHDMYVFGEATFSDNPKNVSLVRCSSKFKHKHDSAACFRKFFLKHFLKYVPLFQTSQVLWKKEKIVMESGFNEDFQRLQDSELFLRVLLNEKTTIKSFLYNGYYDQLRRMTEARYTDPLIVRLKTQVDAVVAFTQYFVKYMQETNNEHYIKKLSSYWFRVEGLVYRNFKESERQDFIVLFEYVKERKKISQVHFDLTYFYMMRLYKTFVMLNVKGSKKVAATVFDKYFAII